MKLVNNLPEYVQDLNQTFEENEQLREANEKYDITGKLEDLAEDLVKHVGDAAGALVDIGAGLVSSIFALVTILVISMFMVGARPGLARRARCATGPPQQAEAMRRATDQIANAVGVLHRRRAGAGHGRRLRRLAHARDPRRPLAAAAGGDHRPARPDPARGRHARRGGRRAWSRCSSTSPPTTIIWAIFAIAYQQFENYVVQPRIQSRAVKLDPFLVVVAALFGGALLGVIGALLAIPTAAAIQIAMREFMDYRRESQEPARRCEPARPRSARGRATGCGRARRELGLVAQLAAHHRLGRASRPP